MKGQLRGSIYLLITAFVWGMAFAAQSSAMEYVEPFTFNAARAIITFAVLGSMLLVKRDFGKSTDECEASIWEYLKIGGVMGIIMVTASSLQQIGLVYTTAGKSGFITALYIVLVPMLGIFSGRKIGLSMWMSVLLALGGLCLLCIKEKIGIGKGELYTLLSALAFSVHIIYIDRFAVGLNAPKLCCVQFLVTAILCGAMALIMETPNWSALLRCLPSLLYVGIMSGAVGYTLQIVGQKYTPPTLASLLMCMESVFAAIGGWILLNERLAGQEIFGCVLMLAACIIAQLPQKNTLHN